jgi:hypothetical protein
VFGEGSPTGFVIEGDGDHSDVDPESVHLPQQGLDRILGGVRFRQVLVHVPGRMCEVSLAFRIEKEGCHGACPPAAIPAWQSHHGVDDPNSRRHAHAQFLPSRLGRCW